MVFFSRFSKYRNQILNKHFFRDYYNFDMPNVTFEHYYPCLYFKIFFKKETRKRKTEGKSSLFGKFLELYLLLDF